MVDCGICLQVEQLLGAGTWDVIAAEGSYTLVADQPLHSSGCIRIQRTGVSRDVSSRIC